MFINYLATQEKIQEKGITADIIKGMSKGLQQCEAADILQNSIHINMGKGETASVDELISATKPGYGFDVAGAMIGFIKKNALNFKITPGYKIIALKSSGPHSNGYTDLRLKLLKGDFETRPEFKKKYAGRFKVDDKFENTTIGKALLEPTKIYVKAMAAIAKKFKVVGANNTGYGLKNLNRYKGNFEFIINDPIEPQPIFDLVQKETKFTDEQMYRKFNMGMGFFIIAKPEDAEEILSIAEKHKEKARVVGEVGKAGSTRTILEKKGKKIVFEGY
jgi:phosphoribosylformylglycinamidine cyclo-ligase